MTATARKHRHRWAYPLNGYAVRSCNCGAVQRWGPSASEQEPPRAKRKKKGKP